MNPAAHQVKRVAVSVLAAGLFSGSAMAADQYIPFGGIRLGSISVIGTGIYGGYMDYMQLLNDRDGGINGVKLAWEECETEYRIDRGVECYERLKKNKATGMTSIYSSYHTGTTYALTERAQADKVPVVAVGSGRTDSSDGRVFPYVFPLVTNYLNEHVAIVKFIGEKEGGMNKLKGKKIVNLFLGIAAAKEANSLFDAQAKQYGFELTHIEIPFPGGEQQAQWLQIRQIKPDWVVMRPAGIAAPAALKTAVKVGFPVNKIVAWWWTGAEEDIATAADAAKGLIATSLGPSGTNYPVMQEIQKRYYGGGKKGHIDDPKRVGSAYYNRGIVHAIIVTEAIRKAQEKFGKRPLNGEEIQWGLEHLTLDSNRIKQLGAAGLVQPLKFSCKDHEGGGAVKFTQWDGKKWVAISDWIYGDPGLVRPIVEEAAMKYAKDKGITPRDCSKEG
ncbi:MAG TPA: ABC transporter substrate-binding protein [Rhodocyclaceae bacterium]|nr:ABC transporter substrate-binding protein [Rhodocyclaceae bacterium]